MKKISQDLEDLLQRYIDGTLAGAERKSLESMMDADANIRLRLQALQSTHALLKELTTPEVSPAFTVDVMKNLDRYSTENTHNIRNGIFLLGGIIIVLLVAVVLSSAGVFNDTALIKFGELNLLDKYVKELPTFSINGKLLVNIIILLNVVIGFVVLDRAILKPLFQRRMQSQH